MIIEHHDSGQRILPESDRHSEHPAILSKTQGATEHLQGKGYVDV